MSCFFHKESLNLGPIFWQTPKILKNRPIFQEKYLNNNENNDDDDKL